LSLPLIANQLYGPSYVSLDYALSHYGLIPEAVYQITSVTTRRSKTYDTPLGRFSYERLALCVYPLGIISTRNEAGHYYLMASKEKVPRDKLIRTSNLPITSPASLLSYLNQDLRLDTNQLADFDPALVRRIAAVGGQASCFRESLFIAGEAPMGIVDEMLSPYPRETEAEETNALREVMQEIALAGLQRAGSLTQKHWCKKNDLVT